MPGILLALGTLLVQLARQHLPGIVGRVLLSFGIGVFSYSVALPSLLAFIQNLVGDLGVVAQAYFGASGFDIGITMILSTAIGIRAHRVLLGKLSGN